MSRLINLAVLVILLVPIATACATVGSGEVGVKTTFGVAKGSSLQPGIHWMTPIVDGIHIYDAKVQAVPEEFGALTSDGQSVTIHGTLNYRINPQHANLVYAQVGGDSAAIQQKVVQPILLSVLKQATAKRSMSDLIANQNAFGVEVEQDLRNRLASERIGQIPKSDIVQVDSFAMSGMKLDDSVQAAIEKTAIAKQSLQTAENALKVAELEAQKNQVLQQSLTPQILMDAAIQKWDGKGIPPTLGSGAQILIQPEKSQ